VARFGEIRSGFDDDRRAMAYASPDLPVPEVLEVGDALGQSYAISRRHHGRFLEDLVADEADAARPMFRRLLTALRDAPRVEGERAGSWREWLRASLRDDDPGLPSHGWRDLLAGHPESDALFARAERRVLELIDGMPERRDLVHGDLLHRNVLVSDDASRVEAVFSWKCSLRGDFLFDVALCTFWSEGFHPGIAALDAFTLLCGDEPDAARRHHCYELHIGTTHLGWYAWTKEHDLLGALTARLGALLERGPRTY
jgi:aminoglycoside phosphotransferase (APT) family kinase protein